MKKTTMKTPPEGMAAAYLCPTTKAVRVWDDGKYRSPSLTAVSAEKLAQLIDLEWYIPIPAWGGVDWDRPPEYCMAPEHMNGAYSHHYAWGPSGTHGCDDGSAVDCVRKGDVAYKRHPQHPEVLVRVWMREDSRLPGAKGFPPGPASTAGGSAANALPEGPAPTGAASGGNPAPTLGEGYTAGDVEGTNARFDAQHYFTQVAKRRALHEQRTHAFQVGAEPVPMSEDFLRALEEQRKKGER